MKGAIIGFGAVAEKGHVPAWNRSRDFSIVAVAESRPERRRIAASLLPGARIYPDPGSLLRAEKDVDFVDIATPPFLHARQAMLALKSGRHVLCEKPLALARHEFGRIREAAAAAKRAVFTVHNWKHAPLFQKLKGLLRSGAVGSVRHMDLHTLRSRPAANIPSAQGAWRTDVKLAGGGILIDHGWHSFYLLRWLLGASPLSASGSLCVPGNGAAEEEAACLLRYPHATATVFLSWRAARRCNRGVVYGDAGTIEFCDDRLVLSRADGRSDTFVFPDSLSHGSAHPDWFHAMLPDFSAAMADPERRKENLGEAEDCLKILKSLYKRQRRPDARLRRASGV